MTDETRELKNGLHRGQRRRAWLGAAAAILAGVIVGGTGTALVSAIDREEEKAEQAVSAVDALCEQVRALGGVCVVDPEDLRGEAGPAGPPGPPPSDEQVLLAVERYCRVNDCAGPRGPAPTAPQVAAAVASYCDSRGECRGEAGSDGADGAPGPAPTEAQIIAAVESFCGERDQCRGPAGPRGPAGSPGPVCPDDAAPVVWKVEQPTAVLIGLKAGTYLICRKG